MKHRWIWGYRFSWGRTFGGWYVRVWGKGVDGEIVLTRHSQGIGCSLWDGKTHPDALYDSRYASREMEVSLNWLMIDFEMWSKHRLALRDYA